MLRYLHYYLCSFHVYKLGDKNSRPHIRNHYVLAQNSYGAYNKAKAICGTDIVSRCSSDLTVCRKKDVIPVNMVEALHEIHLTPEKLIDVELGPNGEIVKLAKRLCDPATGRLIVAGTHLHILKVEASTTPSRAFPDGVDHQAEELEGEFVTVDYIDDANQIHLNESGLALIPGLDDFEIVDLAAKQNMSVLIKELEDLRKRLLVYINHLGETSLCQQLSSGEKAIDVDDAWLIVDLPYGESPFLRSKRYQWDIDEHPERPIEKPSKGDILAFYSLGDLVDFAQMVLKRLGPQFENPTKGKKHKS